MPDRLSPLDATFLHVENGVSHMHIGSVSLFEGPAPAQGPLLAGLEAKLQRAARWRQRVRFVPLEAGRPVWVDDPHFRLDYHVRRTALPEPGGDGELRRLVGRVMSQQLDRHRPLWELWVVEGLADGRWATIAKLHHAMVDGISGSNMITLLMDAEREAPVPAPAPWAPEPAPGDLELVAGAIAERARWPLREWRRLAGAAADPGGFARHGARTVRGLAAYAGLLGGAEPSALNGPIGPHRRWDHAHARLSDVKEIRTALGGTVNDVVLAVITRGLRDLLLGRGEPTDRPIRTLVPVSVRTRGEHGVYDNQVSAMFAELPVGEADPVKRLDAIHAQLRYLKGTHEAEAGEVLTQLYGFAPEVLLALGARLGARAPQQRVGTVATNVPGPQMPLYLTGRRMLESFPYVPIAGNIQVGIAIYSYDGGLGFGITGDWDAAPDISVACAGIEDGMRELLAHARRKRAPRRSAGATTRAGARP